MERFPIKYTTIKKLLLFVALTLSCLMFVAKANAATIYVSNSASNGYAVGNNSNTYAQAQSKTTPKLTVAGGIAVAQSGDTIVINNGTYVESSYLNPSVPMTINSETDYGVTIQVSGTPSYILVPSSAGITLGKLTLDGQNIANEIIHPGATFSGFTINGTRMINFKLYGLNDVGRLTNITMSGGWLIQATTTPSYASGINLSLGNSTNNISNGTVNMTASSTSVIGIKIATSVANNTTTINNVSVNMTQIVPANDITGIFVSGATSATISNNNVVMSGSNIPDGIIVDVNATIQNTHAEVFGNSVTATSGTATSGHGIAVGNDGGTVGAGISGPSVYSNTVTGFNHGCGFFYGVSNGNMKKNVIYKGVTDNGGTIGIISKGGNNNVMERNIVTGGPMVGGALRAKADTGGVFTNNTIIVDSATFKPMYVTSNSFDSKNTTGDVFKNNIIYVKNGVTSGMAILVDSLNVASFYNNDYYGSFSANAWTYQGVSYSDLSSWMAAKETTALNQDPLFINVNSGNFNLNPSSLVIDSGTSTVSVLDYINNSVYGVPDIGAYEYQPTYIMGADSIPVTGSIRIYSNGRYRSLTASSTSDTIFPTNFSVSPVGGTYYGSNTKSYLDLAINNWNTSTTYTKTWTATSSSDVYSTHATSTVYTVGQMVPNNNYVFKLDGVASSTAIVGATCANGVCTSNGNGVVQFTYVGGYSTHVFSLEDATPPSDYSVVFDQANIFSSNQTAASFTFSGAEIGSTYYYSIDDNVSTTTPITGSGTVAQVSQQISGLNLSTLADGTTTLNFFLTDVSGNQGVSTTASILKNVTERALIFSVPSLSLVRGTSPIFDTVSLRLNVAPINSVTVTPVISNLIAIFSTSTITFNPYNWNIFQSLTLFPVESSSSSAELYFTVLSDDLSYNNLATLNRVSVGVTTRISNNAGNSGTTFGCTGLCGNGLSLDLNNNVAEIVKKTVINSKTDNADDLILEPTSENKNLLLETFDQKPNFSKEQIVTTKVMSDMKLLKVLATVEQISAMTNFIIYGFSRDTVKLGEGERRAIIRDYIDTQKTANINWQDVQRIATGKKPQTRNQELEQKRVPLMVSVFKKLVNRTPDFKNKTDDLAWNVLMYRIRFERDVAKESQAITKFISLYKANPKTPFDWAVVRVMAYSGLK